MEIEKRVRSQLPENALTTNVNVAGNLKGWSAAIANKSSPEK